MIEFIRRHPVLSYVLLSFAVSWGGILAIVLPTTFPAPVSEAERLFVRVYLAMLAGPATAGLTIAAIAGRAGVRDYWKRLSRWRVSLRWYAVALLAAPVAMTVTLAALSLVSPAFLPALLVDDTATAGLVHTGGTASFILFGLAVGIGAGFFEELGWTGVATPQLLVKRRVVSSGIVLGVVWGAWHFLAIFWGSANAVGSVPPVVYLLVALFSFLVPYRILMTWLYEHTRSTLVAVLMHASLTSSMLVLGAPVSGWQLIVFDLGFGAVLWIAAAIALARTASAAPVTRRDARVLAATHP